MTKWDDWEAVVNVPPGQAWSIAADNGEKLAHVGADVVEEMLEHIQKQERRINELTAWREEAEGLLIKKGDEVAQYVDRIKELEELIETLKLNEEKCFKEAYRDGLLKNKELLEDIYDWFQTYSCMPGELTARKILVKKLYIEEALSKAGEKE